MSKPSVLRTTTKSKPIGINKEVKTKKETVKSDSVNPKIKVTKPKESPSSKSLKKLSDENPNPEKVSVPKTKVSSKPKIETSKSVLTSSRKPPTKQVPTKSSSTHLNVKTKRPNAPETPPSNRVTSTKYFPSKQLYSNALKEHKPITKVEPERSKQEAKTKTVRSKPKLVETPSQSFEKIERPKTATLRKGSIVNSNIAGPDVPISETPSLTFSLENEVTKEETYEDDFDSYESDFEAYQSSSTPSSPISNPEILSDDTSTTSEEINIEEITKQTLIGIEEEKMLDSGNFELPEMKHKQLLDNIQESNEQLIHDLSKTVRSNPGSLSDEGFEDGKSSIQSGNLQCINFIDAQKKWNQNKSKEKQRKRGEEILSMIQLDNYNITLLDMPAVSYDSFIKTYGKTNRMQISTQTGDDDLSEEIQTDVIETTNKWTQCPVAFSKIDESNSDYMEIYKREFLGVGGDLSDDNLNNETNVNYKRLEAFLAHNGEIMLTLLDELQNNSKQKMRKNSREIPFSSGYIEFETKSHEFLKNRPIVYVCYCSWTNIKILTVHGKSKLTLDDYSNSLICLWSLSNTDEPEKVFLVPGDLTCCCFVSKWKGLIFGGLNDGLISIWDNRNYDKIKFQKEEFQRPNYITEIDNGHSGRIVSIQSLIDSTEELNNSNFNWKQYKDQICSLDENGTLIIWSIISRKPNLMTVLANETITPWSNVCLVQNLKFSLKDSNPDLTDLHCVDMNINVINPNHIFISTNYGYILHCLVSGGKVNPKKYKRDDLSQSNCLEFCPFSPLYFFAGHEDGTIVLYSSLLEKPLISMSNKDKHEQNGIHLLQWSYQKPCVFYAKDRNNTLHLWDLSISDLFPIYSIPFRENITCMKLSPILVKNNDTSYMVLVTDSGNVHLHVLNAEYGPSNLLQYQQDVKKFLNYVNRL